jgi:hypothetical protein
MAAPCVASSTEIPRVPGHWREFGPRWELGQRNSIATASVRSQIAGWLQETAHDLRQGELWSLTPSGRRIVVDVLMRRRGQTARPRSVRLSNACLKKARRRAFR